MKTKLALLSLALAILAAAGGYWLGRRPETPMPAHTTHVAPAKPDEERKALYWYDPMYPQQKFDKPGKSPYMDMELVAKYADEAASGAGGVSINPRVTQNLGVRTAIAESGSILRNVDTLGTVQADETRIVTVQNRADGWVERLHVRAENDKVARGQLLAEIYSPEVLAAQEEYLLLSRRSTNQTDLGLAQAARQRLSLLGLTESQIAKLEQTRHAHRTVSVYAPISGIVTELGVRQGAQVSPGMAMFNLVDLSSLWVVAEVPEDQIGSVQAGTAVNATLAAYPGDRFAGKVDYIYPGLNSETRTVRVRSVIINAQLKLKPGMVAGVHIEGRASKQAVLVPSEAVIRTGTRTVVVVQDEPGKFRPALVTTGVESRGKTEILSGIEAGEHVVISGQFLIDSEANLQTGLSRLGEKESKP